MLKVQVIIPSHEARAQKRKTEDSIALAAAVKETTAAEDKEVT